MTLSEIKMLPYVDFDDRNCLPKKGGIYFVMVGEMIIYIGYSLDLRSRWKRHHKESEIAKLSAIVEVRIAWHERNSYFNTQEEVELISLYSPPLNDANWSCDRRHLSR